MTTAVTAAASVPSSSTAMNTSCSTSVMNRSSSAGHPGEVRALAERGRHAERLQRRPQRGLESGTSSAGGVSVDGSAARATSSICGSPPPATAPRRRAAGPRRAARSSSPARRRRTAAGSPASRPPAEQPVARLPAPWSAPGPTPSSELEGAVVGQLLLERRLPLRLEVERVDQHQPGERVEHARPGSGPRDPVPGLLGHPGVDRDPRALGVAVEVDGAQPGAVLARRACRGSLSTSRRSARRTAGWRRRARSRPSCRPAAPRSTGQRLDVRGQRVEPAVERAGRHHARTASIWSRVSPGRRSGSCASATPTEYGDSARLPAARQLAVEAGAERSAATPHRVRDRLGRPSARSTSDDTSLIDPASAAAGSGPLDPQPQADEGARAAGYRKGAQRQRAAARPGASSRLVGRDVTRSGFRRRRLELAQRPQDAELVALRVGQHHPAGAGAVLAAVVGDLGGAVPEQPRRAPRRGCPRAAAGRSGRGS